MKHAAPRLAARLGIAHIQGLDSLDATGEAIDRAVAKAMSQALAAKHYSTAYAAFARLDRFIADELAAAFQAITMERYNRTAKILAHTLPIPVLQAAAGVPAESIRIKEDRGQVELSFGRPGFRAHLNPPPVTDALSKDEKREAFKRLLLPSMSKEKVKGIIYNQGELFAHSRIQRITRLASPSTLANTIITGVSGGKTRRQIIGDLTPQLHGVRSSARRLARTEGARIANEASMAGYEQLGDMVIGYQVHAVLDERTRPEHAARNGKIYYKNPTNGQDGLDKMPHPPLEADGTIAYNCRCFIGPVFRPLQSVTSDPARMATFTDNADKVIPDPHEYATWYSQAPERKQRQAVGSDRFSLVRDLLGRNPDWVDMIDAETGELVPLDSLRNETTGDYVTRRIRNEEIIAERKRNLLGVVSSGFDLFKFQADLLGRP